MQNVFIIVKIIVVGLLLYNIFRVVKSNKIKDCTMCAVSNIVISIVLILIVFVV